MTQAELVHYKGLIRLSHKIVVYVPSESDGRPIAGREQLLDKVLSTLSDLCGGATSTDAKGYWLSPAGSLIKESVTLAYAYTDDLDSVLDSLLELVLDVKRQAQQESLAFEIDNELYLL